MANQPRKTKKAPAFIQKFLLYLILANFVLVWVYTRAVSTLPAMRTTIVTMLLVSYNLLLCKLVLRRARRHGDSYIIYPVVAVSVLLCCVVFYNFLIA